jgi:hypothetical protein
MPLESIILIFIIPWKGWEDYIIWRSILIKSLAMSELEYI